MKRLPYKEPTYQPSERLSGSHLSSFEIDLGGGQIITLVDIRNERLLARFRHILLALVERVLRRQVCICEKI